MNVLVLMVDQMSPWGCADATLAPHIDGLRKRGTEFTSAYTPSPMCVPARASIATGKYVHEIGTWSSAEPYSGNPKGWAHQIRDAGFNVESFGKLHYRSSAEDTGFQNQTAAVHIPDGVGWVRGLLRDPLASYDITAEMAEQTGPGSTEYHTFDRNVAQHASEWILQQGDSDTPWCAFVSMFSPHYPLICPETDYDPADATPRSAQQCPDHPVLRQMWEFWDHDRHFSDETRGVAWASYKGLCRFVDRQIGKVLTALESSGQAGQTLVIFTSDHGDMMGEHGFWSKSVMYENSARVPLILAGPGFGKDSIHHPVSLVDLAPTLAEAFGLPTSAYSGRTLSDPHPDRTVISEYHDGGAPVGITMVRWNDGPNSWKYVHYTQGNPAQLFDLSLDPDECRNLANECPETVAVAKERMGRILDPEQVNERAFLDQAKLIGKLGGRKALLDMEQWSFTPAESR